MRRCWRFALAWRKSTLLLAVALFAGSLMLVPMIGGEFVPQTDDGFIQLRFKTPVGSSLDYSDAKLRQVEAALAEFKEIESVLDHRRRLGRPQLLAGRT